MTAAQHNDGRLTPAVRSEEHRPDVDVNTCSARACGGVPTEVGADHRFVTWPSEGGCDPAVEGAEQARQIGDRGRRGTREGKQAWWCITMAAFSLGGQLPTDTHGKFRWGCEGTNEKCFCQVAWAMFIQAGSIYHYVIVSFGNYDKLLAVIWPWPLYLGLIAFGACSVQLYYAYQTFGRKFIVPR
ncbi:hypothetical protein GALMADRAFT_211679 [Galerina marginata CBS 339.88]|uniref:Uncharacterized protein n=1 Tax=Galerina marginata (strain CBS 339.88) TaxID=685588 RepID=A0A067SUR6_GALM3|nr:hypothetical protein GALMADRAFT_211679 [Galerina marginata CBS 339.88]